MARTKPLSILESAQILANTRPECMAETLMLLMGDGGIEGEEVAPRSGRGGLELGYMEDRINSVNRHIGEQSVSLKQLWDLWGEFERRLKRLESNRD